MDTFEAIQKIKQEKPFLFKIENLEPLLKIGYCEVSPKLTNQTIFGQNRSQCSGTNIDFAITDILKQMTESLLRSWVSFHAHHQLESIPEESRSTAGCHVAFNKLYVM